MCKTECKLERLQHTLSSSETDLNFVGIPSDSQGLVCSGGHGVILNHYHLHSCSLLQGYKQTGAEKHIKELPGPSRPFTLKRDKKGEFCHILAIYTNKGMTDTSNLKPLSSMCS